MARPVGFRRCWWWWWWWRGRWGRSRTSERQNMQGMLVHTMAFDRDVQQAREKVQEVGCEKLLERVLFRLRDHGQDTPWKFDIASDQRALGYPSWASALPTTLCCAPNFASREQEENYSIANRVEALDIASVRDGYVCECWRHVELDVPYRFHECAPAG